MKSKDAATVVVVGTGVAGALVALKLARAGIDTLMLEAGPRVERGQLVENYRNCAYKEDYQAPFPPAPHAPHPQYSPDNDYLVQMGPEEYKAGYLRLAGGTTWHWAGLAWRLLPNDFRMQSAYGIGRDWPLEYDDLEAWYQVAEEEMGVAGPNEGLNSPRQKPYPLPALPLSDYDRQVGEVLLAAGYRFTVEPAARLSLPYNGRPACSGNNNCMPICPSGAQLSGYHLMEKAELAGARVLSDAVVHKIEHDAKGRISSVLYRDPTGTDHRVEGKHFVLACGGIETPKLMLISPSDRYPDGIGNSSGMVGRNLMDHPGISVTFLSEKAMWPGRGPQQLSCLVDFQDGAFRSEHSAMKINFNNYSPVRNVAQLLISKGVFGKDLDKRIREYCSRWVSVDSFLDIPPDPDNRISASTSKRDALGIPLPVVHYKILPYVDRGAAVCRQHFDRIASLFNGSEVRHADGYFNNNHIMGTVMMGDDPADSVVDKDLRCHDHPNLYLATSGTMVSSGTVNCTLTIGAFSVRLADTLIREVGHA